MTELDFRTWLGRARAKAPLLPLLLLLLLLSACASLVGARGRHRREGGRCMALRCCQNAFWQKAAAEAKRLKEEKRRKEGWCKVEEHRQAVAEAESARSEAEEAHAARRAAEDLRAQAELREAAAKAVSATGSFWFSSSSSSFPSSSSFSQKRLLSVRRNLIWINENAARISRVRRSECRYGARI